jgi:hypothetical protein
MEPTKLDALNSSNQTAPKVKLATLQEKPRNKPGPRRFPVRMKPFKPVLATITENIEGERLEEEIAKLSADGIGLNGIDTNQSVGPSRVPDWLTQQDDADLLEPIPTETNQTELGGLKRITLKMMESASIPKNCFVILRAKGKNSHGIKFQTKTISTRNSDWNEPFSFSVDNTEYGVISVKIKKISLFGVLMSSTIGFSHTFLSDLTNGTTHYLLPDLKAEVEIVDVENQPDLAKMKRDQRKSKAKLILREISQHGIDPLHTITFGPQIKFGALGPNKKESLEKPEKKSQDVLTPNGFLHPQQIKKPSFWVKHGFIDSKHRYTRRRFE